jgi:hypothetical protein
MSHGAGGAPSCADSADGDLQKPRGPHQFYTASAKSGRSPRYSQRLTWLQVTAIPTASVFSASVENYPERE